MYECSSSGRRHLFVALNDWVRSCQILIVGESVLIYLLLEIIEIALKLERRLLVDFFHICHFELSSLQFKRSAPLVVVLLLVIYLVLKLDPFKFRESSLLNHLLYLLSVIGLLRCYYPQG